MKKRRILILGASLMQLPAIKEAKNLGLEVVAVDANPHAVSIPFVDSFENIDLKDVPTLIDFAKNLCNNGGLSAVFTAATDFSVSVASIAEALSLPSHSLLSAMNASDKGLMRSIFTKNKITSPSFIEVSDVASFKANLLDNFSYPLVVKPSDNMGARGCRLVDKDDDIIPIIEKALSYSRSSRVIVEEFVAGPEFSIEGLVFNGNVHITALADRHIYYPPYFVEMGHTIPSIYPAQITDKIVEIFIKGVNALGLSHGACKGDVFFDKKRGEAIVGEIAARLSGGYMSGWTAPYSSSINVTRLALQLALGEEPDFIPSMPTKYNSSRFSSEMAYISIPGKVREVMGLYEAKASSNIKDVFPRCKAGDEVVFPKNNVEKAGNVISLSSSYENAIASSTQSIKNIFIRLEAFNDDTDLFLESYNDDLLQQECYPPNYFIFTDIKDDSLKECIKNSDYTIEDDIVYPTFFSSYLDDVSPPMCLSIREAIKMAFSIVPRIKDLIIFLIENRKTEKEGEALIKCWLSFVRAGSQGLVYWFDSYKKNG